MPDRDADTVVDAIAALRAAGYGGDFEVAPGGQIICMQCRELHAANEATVEVIYRFEGESDPGDEVAVFGLVCARCGSRGVLVTAYGPTASADEAAVVTSLQQDRP